MSFRTNELSILEKEALMMIAGIKPMFYGAWFSACCEFLSEDGYVSRSLPYRLTERGEKYVDEHLRK